MSTYELFRNQKTLHRGNPLNKRFQIANLLLNLRGFKFYKKERRIGYALKRTHPILDAMDKTSLNSQAYKLCKKNNIY